MELNSKIYVAGHNGLVGSAIVRKLKQLGYTNLIFKSSKECDLRNQNDVLELFEFEKPEYIFLAAAKVGGIKSNSLYKADFIYDNLLIQTNIISASNGVGVKKLLFLGSSCFPSGNIVAMNNCEFKDISDVNINDIVIDSSGNKQLVSAVNKKNIEEDILLIKPLGMTVISVTKEHPFLLKNGEFINAEKLIIGNKLVIPISKYKIENYVSIINDELEISKREAFNYIKNGGKLTETVKKFNLSYSTISGYIYNDTKPKSMQIPIGCNIHDVAWLTGVFLAEGWLSGVKTNKRGGKHIVAFSPGCSENFKNKIVHKIISVFNIKPIVTKERTSYKITINNKFIYSFFEKCYINSVHMSYTKKIPDFIFNSNKDSVIEVIKGYFEGDGCKHIRKNRNNQYTCVSSSTSYNLTYGLFQLISRLGIFASINFVKKKNVTIIEDRKVNQRNQYSLRINGNWAIKFLNIVFGENLSLNKEINNGVEFVEDCFYVPITKISTINYSGYVYNFTVEETNTYCVNNIAVHNCIYPKMCPQPIKEEYLLSGYLEESNDAYAIAKIAGIKMCQAFNQQYNTNFISVMPTNMFGIGDNYHPENSHVIPGLIRRFHDAKVANQKDVICWGDGTPMREFLFNEDLADACIFLMNNYKSSDIINIGTGKDMTIKELTEIIKSVVYPGANIVFNNDVNLNGTPRKVLDTTKINTLGWSPKVSFEEGVKIAYEDFLKSFIS